MNLKQKDNLPNAWKEVKLSEVLDYEQPNDYIVNTKILDEETSIPVLTANKGFIKGYTKETEGIYKNLPAIIFDDFTTDTKFVNFPFKVKSSAMKILKLKVKEVLLKYIFYQMQTVDVRTTTHKRYYLSEYQNLDFLFPVDEKNNIDFKTQEEVVSAIETQFTRLDEAVKSLKSVKDKLEIYKKAVLKKAFEKKEGWEENSFSECFNSISPSYKINRENYLENGKLPIVDQGEKLIGGYIDDESKKQKIILPVIIFGDHTRIFKFVNFDFVQGADGIKILEIKHFLDPKFTYYQSLILKFPNKGYSRHFQYVKKANFKFPKSLFEQQSIVQAIESKFSVIDKVEEVIEASLKKAEMLRKSILKSAFEGKLVKEEEIKNER